MILNGDPALRRRLLDIAGLYLQGGEEMPAGEICHHHGSPQNKRIRRSECGNYRGILLVVHAGKILLNMIARHLSEDCMST